MREELARRHSISPVAVNRDAPNAFAVILLDAERGERIVLWDRDPRLALLPSEVVGADLATARLVHVDDVDEMPRSARRRIARGVGLPVTSDIERLTERTDELVASVTVPIFAEHVLQELTGKPTSSGRFASCAGRTTVSCA
jgi:sugar/nucleoside kinase (ribokinase family)